MSRTIARLLLPAVVGLLALAGCNGKPDPPARAPTTPAEIAKEPNAPEVPDPLKAAKTTPTDAAACAKLRELGCVEGSPKRGKCEDTFEHARTNEPALERGKTDGIASCVAKSASIAAVRMCGGANTLTFECPGK